jgi:hypothetical protein
MDNTHLGNGILGAAEAPASAEGSRDTTLDPTRVSTGGLGQVDDGRGDNVVVLSPDKLASLRPAAGRRSRPKTVWLPIEDSYYPDFEFEAKINYTQELENDIRSADEDRIAKALAKIVLRHNDWHNDEGEPYPQPDDPKFWQMIPSELLATMLALVRLEANRLPNSKIENYRNMRNT